MSLEYDRRKLDKEFVDVCDSSYINSKVFCLCYVKLKLIFIENFISFCSLIWFRGK